MNEQQRKAMELALDAIKNSTEYRIGNPAYEQVEAAIKQAMVQKEPEQEPVAWCVINNGELIEATLYRDYAEEILAGQIEGCGSEMAPLYITPYVATPRPQPKPLTDEEIWKFWWARPEVPEGEDDSMEAEFIAAVRAIEVAHGIKE